MWAQDPITLTWPAINEKLISDSSGRLERVCRNKASYPTMKSVLIFNDTSHDMHYGCDAVMHALVEGLHKNGIDPIYFSPVRRDWRLDLKLINSLKFDGIIVNGEGSIHDTQERKTARDLIGLGELGEANGCPAFLINSTLSNLRPQDFESLRKFAQIFVREHKSFDLLKDNGLDGIVAPDLSFTCKKVDKPIKGRSGVLITDSVIPCVTEALTSLSRNYGTFCPVKFDPKESRSLTQRITNKIRKVLGSPNQNPPSHPYTPKTDYQIFINKLYCSELLITGRFHAVTLALATQTPFIALDSNTHKIKSVLQDALGSTSRVKYNMDIISSLLATEGSDCAPYSTAELTALDKYNKRSEKLIDEMFATISRML